MANRRMFAKSVTDSDEFLELPYSAQALYFHIGMQADDDGYCGKVSISRLTKCQPNDIQLLVDAEFIYPANDKVLFVIHWKENNQLRKDRYKPSKHEELYGLATNGLPDGNQRLTQVRLGKVSIGKDREEKKQAKKKETISLPDWLDKEAWEAWVNYRNEIRKKLTPSMIKKQIAFLEKDKEHHKGIMDRSIMNGWTGLFPLDNQPEYSKPTRTRSPEVEAALANQFKMEEE